MSRQFGRPERQNLLGRRSGRPNRRPAVLAKFLAEILRGGLSRPNRRRVLRPRTAADPHRCFIPISWTKNSSGDALIGQNSDIARGETNNSTFWGRVRK